MLIAYISYTDSLSFWLILEDSRPINHRQSIDIPPTMNGQLIGRVSVGVSPDTRPTCRSTYRSICRPTYLGRHIGRVSVDTSTDISAECRSIRRPPCQSSIGRYVDRYVGRGVYKIHMIPFLYMYFIIIKQLFYHLNL